MPRYIDADAIRQRMYHEVFETDTDMQKWDSGCWIRYKLFANCLGSMPTISPDDVCGMGKWIDKPTGRYGQWQSWCSACGKRSGIGGIKSNRHKPYCPNCGAKMEVTSDE